MGSWAPTAKRQPGVPFLRALGWTTLAHCVSSTSCHRLSCLQHMAQAAESSVLTERSSVGLHGAFRCLPCSCAFLAGWSDVKAVQTSKRRLSCAFRPRLGHGWAACYAALKAAYWVQGLKHLPPAADLCRWALWGNATTRLAELRCHSAIPHQPA